MSEFADHRKNNPYANLIREHGLEGPLDQISAHVRDKVGVDPESSAGTKILDAYSRGVRRFTALSSSGNLDPHEVLATMQQTNVILGDDKEYAKSGSDLAYSCASELVLTYGLNAEQTEAVMTQAMIELDFPGVQLPENLVDPNPDPGNI